MNDPGLPKDVDAVTMVFPANVVGTLLPEWDEIPKAWRNRFVSEDRWIGLFDHLFYEGLKDGQKLVLVPKPGIDGSKAFRHIRACMSSFEPKHEHKTAGCAWMFDSWFSDFRIESASADESRRCIIEIPRAKDQT